MIRFQGGVGTSMIPKVSFSFMDGTSLMGLGAYGFELSSPAKRDRSFSALCAGPFALSLMFETIGGG
jgi:hypothetical protein